EGDLILSFAGMSIKHARQLPRFVAQVPVGDEVEAVILRGGERKILKIKVGSKEELKGPELMVTPPIRSKRPKIGKIRIDPGTDAEGVAVAKGSLETAIGSALEPGDLIVEAAHQKVRTVEELEARLYELKQLQRTEALLTFEKPGG